MQSQTYGISLVIFSAITLGISNSLYKHSSEVLSPVTTTFYYYVFSAILATAVWIYSGETKVINNRDLIWPALIAVFLFASVLSFNFAIMHLSISMGATIRAFSFLVTALIGIFFYKDSLSWQQVLAVIFSIASIILASMGKADSVS